MKLYIVDVSFHREFYRGMERIGCKRGLVSYWECVADNGGRPCGRFDFFRQPGRELFLDSGAFTAYTQGVKIDLYEYIGFIREYGVEVYCNLDVIRDEEGTRENQAEMERAGLSPIPVFHLGESWGYLEELLERYEYVALGVAGTQGERRCDDFLEGCFSRIAKHWPVRVHGFGITTQRYLERYPFYSVDSSSAILGAAMGRVFHWRGRKLVSGSYKERGTGSKHASLVDDEEGKSRHVARRLHNVKMQMELEDHITRLWERRGVRWED